ncbi:MAG TPA: hypothetical protein VFQ91_13905 [Bryobacteraceae bacterium]|nr:hypothetical protein [Bryobacteraceae bacterium]
MRALLLLCLFAVGSSGAEPRMVSIHPFTGQLGVAFTVTVRGSNLKDTRSVFTEPGAPKFTIEEALADSVRLRVEAEPDAKSGRYSVRLVTPGGVTNALPIQIIEETVLREPEGKHETPETAVQVASLPAIYTGRIDKRGESDFYEFEAKAGETLSFEALSGLPSLGAPGGNARGFDPSLTIFEASGSWFDAKRLNRLAYNDEPLWVLGRLTDAHLQHVFTKSGRYFVRLDAFSGQGGPDYAYKLRILRGSVPPEKPLGALDWDERTFSRRLSSDRLNELAARGGKPQNQKSIETYRTMGKFSLPATLEGAIAEPGEAHRAQFHVDGPQDIAIEVETPDTAPPLFNPVVRITDSKGEEVVTNFFAGRGACTGALNKGLTAKTIYPLRNPGDYTVEVRDVTADLGEKGFRYRVQIRPQVAHIGAVRIEEDHINLAPGGAKTVRVTFDREEDYRGAVAVLVEGLPEGVTALAAADYEPDKDPPMHPGKRERYVARTERTVLAFSADEKAAVMDLPKTARVTVRPVVDGKPGQVIASKEIPLMVVKP